MTDAPGTVMLGDEGQQGLSSKEDLMGQDRRQRRRRVAAVAGAGIAAKKHHDAKQAEQQAAAAQPPMPAEPTEPAPQARRVD